MKNPSFFYTLTEEDVMTFRKQGYWISPKLLEQELIMRLGQAFDQVFESYAVGLQDKSPRGSVIQRLCNLWLFEGPIRELVLSPLLGAIAAQLLQTPSIRLWRDHAIVKAGHRTNNSDPQAGNVGWHQDANYWRCVDTTNICTAWIPFQDTEIKNGTMRMVPGSHQWGLIEDAGSSQTKGEGGFFCNDLNVKPWASWIIDKPNKTWREEPVVVKAGQLSFHHALLFHCSGPNYSDDPRQALAVNFLPKGAARRRDDESNQFPKLSVNPIKVGQTIEGPYFPKLWPNSETNPAAGYK